MQEMVILRIDPQFHALPFFLGNKPLLAQNIVEIIQPQFFGHL